MIQHSFIILVLVLQLYLVLFASKYTSIDIPFFYYHSSIIVNTEEYHAAMVLVVLSNIDN